MKTHHAVRALALTAIAAFAAGPALAQQLDLPRVSPKASVSQRVGVTDVEILYNRPGVRDRKIWGELVPYGEVWRTGANENTTISFSTPVKVEGTELPAGTYGLHTLPTEGDWTVILSKDTEAWGSYQYKPENDAARIQVTPRRTDRAVERMRFTFEDVTDGSAEVVLAWENLEVPFTIETDTAKNVASLASGAVRWQTPYQAANWCIQNKTCLAEASRWLDASIAIEPNFVNQRAKAMLLAEQNDTQGAVSWGEKALAAAKSAAQPPPPQQVSDLESKIQEWKKGM
jgi:hypothetical protein